MRAFLAYLAIALVMTWPLAMGLGRDVPGDLGDSLLNMWILGWSAEHAPRLVTGQSSLPEYWNANIFHPEPLALGFSEHLFGEALQILPVYWLTGNLILCYNLLFLSSFALSGLGMFLLTRDLLGTTTAAPRTITTAAFIAGLIFAFIPLRIAQVAHIQSLQTQWMPLALYGFRRFILTQRLLALVGGAAALLMQNWTNGYYLVFFAPFVPVFVIHQMWTAGRLRSARVWLGLGAAASIVAAGTWPFLAMYRETQRVHAFARPMEEVVRYSADVYSYLTAAEALRVWGSVMQAFPKPEGELFFGIVPWLLALLGATTLARVRTPAPEGSGVAQSPLLRFITVALLAVIAIQAAGLVAILFTRGFVTSFAGVPIRATNAPRVVFGILIATVSLLTISRNARSRALAVARSPGGLAALLLMLGLWLSLGPAPQSSGRPLTGVGLYSVLYEHVPGFDGLRVPARYAMIAAVFLSVLSGYGAATMLTRRATAIAAGVALLFLVEVGFAPMTLNATWADGNGQPPDIIVPADAAPAVYHTLAGLPDSTVVAEFPFGEPAWELRYVYYSSVHWKRLVNGYSGGFPHEYQIRVALLQRVHEDPEAAWRALRDAGTTHVVVHEHAFGDGTRAAAVMKWLNDHFAVEIARFDGDVLFDVSGVWPPK